MRYQMYLRGIQWLVVFPIYVMGFWVLQAPLGYSERNGVPENYAECLAAEQTYRTESSQLKCVYRITTNEENNEETTKYLECWTRYPEQAHGISVEACHFVANEGNPVVSRQLQCQRVDGINFYPGTGKDTPCRLLFYNPQYVLPASFEECVQKEGEISMTYMGEKTCRVTVALFDHSEFPSEASNKDVAVALINKCKDLQGTYTEIIGRYPECELFFIETGKEK